MRRKTLLLIAATIVTIGVAITVVLLGNATKADTAKAAQPIPQGTSFSKVRELSVGKKPACLNHNTALDQTVAADDKLPFDKSMSMALGTVIPDMPAGHTTVYLSSYTTTSATGYEIFSDKNQQNFVGDLKQFNFSIKRTSADSDWTLSSFTACVQ